MIFQGLLTQAASKLSEVRRKKSSNPDQSLIKLEAGSDGESIYLTLDNYIARNRCYGD